MSNFLRFRIPLGLTALALVSACSEKAIQSQSFGDNSILATKAEYRTVTRTSVTEASDFGRMMPSAIVCAEPSPDVAKAVSESFQLDSEIAADIAGKGSGSLALAMATQRAEAIAQMTERIATIQLLRDGMYRACEAYANGALSKTDYAVILSRYDDTMVTLLLAELAAGNFGRSLAGISAGAASQAGEIEKAAESAQSASNDLDKQTVKKQSELNALDQQIAAKEQEVKDAEAADKAQRQAELAELESQRQGLAGEIEVLKQYKSLASDAAVHGSVLAISLRSRAAPAARTGLESAKLLERMQKNYLHDINVDAVEIACLSVLSDTDGKPTLSALASHCQEKVVPALSQEKGKLLRHVLGESEADAGIKKKDRYVELLQGLLKDAGYDVGQIDGIAGPLTQKAIVKFEAEHPALAKQDQDPVAFLFGVREAAQQKLSAGD